MADDPRALLAGLPVANMLLTPANVVLASLIWSQWQEGGSYGSVAATSLLAVGLTGMLALAARITIRKTLNPEFEAAGTIAENVGPSAHLGRQQA